ncbi:hypothetical protein N0M98_22885 [Paenibacillus doosanensis]|uniref:hypothetical protein n=1 Tax=Paenibacillus doosanensis TaxID=1229154 RepID=UPI00218099CD|nr:hypothetical protein [Paenibacillus doosanensis]MCS7462976.1 hypothetical protein [Paenibacillus doosanensis]
MTIDIDSIILGDNQFFGVNHMSHERGNVTQEHFKNIEEIKKVLFYAIDNGVSGIMFSTHPAIYQITDMIRADHALRDHFNIYVNVPYVTKYISMINTMGLFGTIQKMLEGKSYLDKAGYVLKSLMNVGTKNYLQIANRLIDVELNPFYDLKVKSIFLHNALTDLALGYKMENVITSYDSYIKKQYGAIPAYGTLNYPRFSQFLNDAGISQSLVMTAVNKKGFLMNPGREAVEAEIKKGSHTVLAMATLASGSISPEEAYDYVFSLGHIKHVVVGLSSKHHADETFRILRRYLR